MSLFIYLFARVFNIQLVYLPYCGEGDISGNKARFYSAKTTKLIRISANILNERC
jgi:hypothetical protein